MIMEDHLSGLPVYFLAAVVGAQVVRTAAEHGTKPLLYFCATWGNGERSDPWSHMCQVRTNKEIKVYFNP